MNHGFENEEKEPMAVHEHREPQKTLRDEFAMAALTALISSHMMQLKMTGTAFICERAYLWADAMLKAREVE